MLSRARCMCEAFSTDVTEAELRTGSQLASRSLWLSCWHEVMQHLGVVLSTSTSNISSQRSRQVSLMRCYRSVSLVLMVDVLIKLMGVLPFTWDSAEIHRLCLCTAVCMEKCILQDNNIRSD